MKETFLRYEQDVDQYHRKVKLRLRRKKSAIGRKKFKKEYWVTDDGLVWFPKARRAAATRNKYALTQELILKIADDIRITRAIKSVDNST
jgi:hypothetical protein